MRRIIGTFLALTAAAFTALLVPGQVGSANAAGHTPVVFVHGFLSTGATWDTAKSVFEQGGYTSDELYAYEYDFTKSNVDSANGLASLVQQVLSSTGASQVDIVNHSMGGLVSDWYLHELGGSQYVRHLASIAGANHGTNLSQACQFWPSCVEMIPGSSFIQTVTSGDETPGATSYATWYSSCDGVIDPYTSTILDGANNTNVACESHSAYLTDTAFLAQVRGFLAT